MNNSDQFSTTYFVRTSSSYDWSQAKQSESLVTFTLNFTYYSDFKYFFSFILIQLTSGSNRERGREEEQFSLPISLFLSLLSAEIILTLYFWPKKEYTSDTTKPRVASNLES